MKKLRIMECFGGIGACSKALERLGIDYEIADYVEIDKYAVKSFNAIHNTNFEPQDICKWNKDIKVDLIMHGSPCQDFSLAGKQAGGDKDSGTRSSLMYETIRIVEKLKPKYVIWENVKNLLSKKHRHNFDAYLETMEQLGYTNYYQVLNAKDYGIPQNRERVFTVSILDNQTEKDEKISLIVKDFRFPEKKELKLKLKDMLEDEVDEKYYLSDKMIKYISADNEKWTGNNDKSLINKSVASAINTGEGSRRCDASNYISNQVEENFNLKIKNNTKKGYLEAVEGDGVNISSRMKYQRGNVQEQTIQTITTSGGNDRGVVVKSVYSDLEEQLFTKDGNIKRYIDSDIVDEFKEGQMATTSFPNGYGHGPRTHDESICLNCIDKPSVKQNLRIRKLTPKEVWRLMGFDDADFEKAAKVNSNSQLYKQAGNSIVVNVLEAILNNLLNQK